MALLRHGGSRPFRSQRRKTSWNVGPSTGTNGTPESAISTGTALLANLSATVSQDGQTVVRIRGDLLLYLVTASASGEGMSGAFGIGLATSAAVAVGVTAVPTPLTEESNDNWLYHRYFSLFSAADVVAAGVSENQALVHPLSAVMHEPIDSKAMRKVNIGDSIYMALETEEAGTAVIRWAANCRLLTKLP